MQQSGFLKRKQIFSEKKVELEDPDISFKTKDEFIIWMNKRMETLDVYGVSNCIGTALYVVGELKEDKYVWNEKEIILNKLTKINYPKKGFLIAWNRGYIYHFGIITNENPFSITHRDGVGEFVLLNESLESVDKGYNCEKDEKVKIEYLIPTKLEKLL